MKFVSGGLYSTAGRECVLIEKKRDEKDQLVVVVKFVGTRDCVMVPSNIFDQRYRLVKGAGKHIRIRGWKRR